MSKTEQINSDSYWDARFSEDWEAFDGPAQSKFFARIAVEHFPTWFRSALYRHSLSVADWGCAQGDGTRVLNDYVTNGCLTGIDFSSVAINDAVQRHPNIRFIHSNWLEGVASDEEVYDVVFSSNTLEHFTKPFDVLIRLCDRATKAIVLALPYREVDRLDEHFFSFYPDNIPSVLPGEFRLVWSKVIDCRTLEDSCWPGEQIILIYANSAWVEGLNLQLLDVQVQTESSRETILVAQREAALAFREAEIATREAVIAQCNATQTQRESALGLRESALGLRDALAAEREVLLLQNEHVSIERNLFLTNLQSVESQRDAALQDFLRSKNLADEMRTSLSWRLMSPLRFIGRMNQHGLIEDDRRKLRNAVRSGYLQLPLTASIDKAFRTVYKKIRGVGRRLALPESVKDAWFVPPSIQPAARNPAFQDYIVWGVIDWHFRYQRPQHLARALAASGRRVFYISANIHDNLHPGFAIESLDDSRRLFQINLYVAGAPSIYSAAPGASDLTQLQRSIGELLEWANTDSTLSLVHHPYWYGVAGALPRGRMIYDCMDHHEGFGNNTAEILKLEKALLRDADLTIATSAWLQQLIAPSAQRCAVIRNAGDFFQFSDVPTRVFRDPSGRKILGYMGAIAEWFDQDLIEAMAKRFPKCLILLIGNDTAGAQQRLKRFSNIQFIGEVAYSDLPYYVHSFDICLLPFKVIPLTLATNPVKIYEYLGAGKPVVAVELPEMLQFGDLVLTAETHDAFLDATQEMLATPATAERIEARQAFAREQTWAHRSEELLKQIGLPVNAPFASVIVVTYNNVDLTRACLDSLERYTDYPAFEIIVVDNASSDGSQEYLSQWVDAGPRRQLILNETNDGFAAANNQGLAAAHGDYLVLLNNDTHVTPGWLGTLIAHLRRNPDIGLLGPITNNIGNEAKIDIQYDSMRQMLERSASFTRRHIDSVFGLRTVAFFCVIFPRSVYVKVGRLDEIFGRGFFEDDDYCRRVEQLGLRIVCAEDVFIHHNLSASFNKLNASDRQSLFEKNKVTYESKWGPWTPHVYKRDRMRINTGSIVQISLSPTFSGHRHVTGLCNVCGHAGRFFYTDIALWRESLTCEKCLVTSRYRSIARGVLRAIKELRGIDAESLATLSCNPCKPVLRLYDTQPPFYYLTCSYPMPDMLKSTGWIDVALSQYKPDKDAGERISEGVTNQNLECLTYANNSLDIVVTSDVMEHVRLDNRAHSEIYRVLKPGGIYIFTVPHDRTWAETLVRVHVADAEDSSKDVHLLEPEYHGDTNSDDNSGVLAYRTYGRDIETTLVNLGFEVEYFKENIERLGILNTELFYCRKTVH